MRLSTRVMLTIMFVVLLGGLAPAEEVPRSRLRSFDPSPFAYADPGNLQISEATVESLGDSVADWVQAGKIAGAEVLVLEGESVVWHELFGYRDLETREQMEPGGIFRVRSMTKPMLGSAALRLVDRGMLKLDEPVGTYLPEFAGEKNQQITVRRLLAHTSGLSFSPFPRDRGSYNSLRESVVDVAGVGPEFPAGEFHYSDAGSATLGALLEEVSGKPLETILNEEVFEPIGLMDTFTSFEADVPWRNRMNSTHRWDSDLGKHRRYWSPAEEQELSYFRASGGIYSSVFDYASFLRYWMDSLKDGNDYLSLELVQEALSQQTETPYGFHWEVTEDSEGQPLMFGHGGSDGTMAIAVPEFDLVVLFFTQSRGCDCRDQFAMLAGLTGEFGPLGEYTMWGRWRETIGLDGYSTTSESDLEKYVGLYETSRETVSIQFVDGALRLKRTKSIGAEIEPQSDFEGEVSCLATLSPPFPYVNLIPMGDDEFLMGKYTKGELSEIYWPDKKIRFSSQDGKIIGYELEYDPQIIERGRRYEFVPSKPMRRREQISDDLLSTIVGTYESVYGRVEVTATTDKVTLDWGRSQDILFYQGDGFFIGERGEIVTFSTSSEGRQRLQALDTDGMTYTFQKW